MAMCEGGGLFKSDTVAGGAVRVVADAERLLQRERACKHPLDLEARFPSRT